jgi:membrane protein YqaA with SNARE-associated domain
MDNDDGYYIEVKSTDEIILPSNKKRKKPVISKRHKKELKWGIIFFIIFLVYMFYNQIILFILEFLKSNPTLYSNYLYIESEISNQTLKGLFYMSVFGSIFFLLMPSEALLIYYLSSTNYFFIVLLSIMILGNVIGMIFNYFFGRILGERIIMWMFSEKKFYDYKDKIDRLGGIVLFFGNILPGPIELLAVFYGGFKYDFTRYLYLTLIGRLIKFVLIFLAFFFFWSSSMNNIT